MEVDEDERKERLSVTEPTQHWLSEGNPEDVDKVNAILMDIANLRRSKRQEMMS